MTQLPGSTGDAAPDSRSPLPNSSTHPPSPGYARYTLAVLVLVYVLNFLDRNIISILAEDIKADLSISDAQLGFLQGTAFAVFYAIFGIPLGRLADVWNRRSLIAAGLAFWSLMTALSGFSRTFAQLATARVGVGVGEASATPAAYSMISDLFPTRMRATVLAIYASGAAVGGGLGLMIGGQIVERWNLAFPSGETPFDLAGWQVAYLVVGLPGLFVALWVRTLREPKRGAVDGIESPSAPDPFGQFLLELRSIVPPFTLYHLWSIGAGLRGVLLNLVIGTISVAGAVYLIHLTGSTAQWLAIAFGLYAGGSWVQALGHRDRVSATLILRGRAFLAVCLGFSGLSFSGFGIAAWTPVFFMRVHEQSSGEVGIWIGLTAASGAVGVISGGWLADRMRQHRREGRLYVAMAAGMLVVPLTLWMLETQNVTLAYVINIVLSGVSAMGAGVGASTVQDLVLPRMRGVASAFYLLVLTFLGVALGPYLVGKLSDTLGVLPLAMQSVLLANVVAVALFVFAARHLANDENSLIERARQAGEPGLEPRP
jgi:MFS family permease